MDEPLRHFAFGSCCALSGAIMFSADAIAFLWIGSGSCGVYDKISWTGQASEHILKWLGEKDNLSFLIY